MLQLLSKLKDDCRREGIDLLHSGINGDAIKLACSMNMNRMTELNAYIVPDGDGYNFYTQSPTGDKSEVSHLAENEIIPAIKAAVNPGSESHESTEGEESKSGIEEVTIEVADGVFDTKEVNCGTYKNSRYAYSDKYHKMGTIVSIKTKS